MARTIRFADSSKKLIQEWASFSQSWDASWMIVDKHTLQVFVRFWLPNKNRKLIPISDLFYPRTDIEPELWRKSLPEIRTAIKSYTRIS